MKLHEFKFLSDGSYVWNHPDPDSQITVEIHSKYTKSYIDKYNVKQEYITTIYLNAFDMSCVVDNLKTHKLQEFKVVSPPFNSLLLAVEFAKPICSKYNRYKDALTKKLKNKIEKDDLNDFFNISYIIKSCSEIPTEALRNNIIPRMIDMLRKISESQIAKKKCGVADYYADELFKLMDEISPSCEDIENDINGSDIIEILKKYLNEESKFKDAETRKPTNLINDRIQKIHKFENSSEKQPDKIIK